MNIVFCFELNVVKEPSTFFLTYWKTSNKKCLGTLFDDIYVFNQLPSLCVFDAININLSSILSINREITLLKIYGNKRNILKFWKSFKGSGYNNKNISQQKMFIRYNDINIPLKKKEVFPLIQWLD